MTMLQLFRKFLFTIFMVIPLFVLSQDDPKPNKKQKKAEQKKEQRKVDAKKSEVKSKKQHAKIQDKATRKRMKQNKRKGSQYVSRRPGFFSRLFHGFK